MTPRWEDVNARARGLSTHLLSRGDLETLARQPDLPALAEELGRLGIIAAGGEEGTAGVGVERGIRRWGAGLLRILARWVGERSTALPLVFADEDRRSLRALVRGAVARIPTARRLAGLLPTPALPALALEQLAGAATVGALAAQLSVWRHPFAVVLAPFTATGEPDLFSIERALGRSAAEAAVRAAGRSGSAPLRAAVAEGIDLENAALAVLLAGAGEGVPGAADLLPGGDRLPAATFVRAIATHDPRRAATLIGPLFGATPYAKAITEGGTDPARLEMELFRLRVIQLTRRVRQVPLEPLTTLWFALRLRAQMIDLQRIVWAVVLDAPRAPLRSQWISVAA